MPEGARRTVAGCFARCCTPFTPDIFSAMLEYKITRQTVGSEDTWVAVPGAPARESDLYPPAGEDWTLHSFEHGDTRVVAVWTREKRLHAMSEIYSHSDAQGVSAAAAPIKTVADIPEPK